MFPNLELAACDNRSEGLGFRNINQYQMKAASLSYFT